MRPGSIAQSRRNTHTAVHTGRRPCNTLTRSWTGSTRAGLSWKLYTSDYDWAICPSFADCLDTSQKLNMVAPSQFTTDAQNGTLPSFSILLPQGGNSGATSQHNGTSMAVGDNWIGAAVNAVENGPDWSSTAIFITWDDCGCFYDHVPPPVSTWGIRMPMIIVSPYAKPGYTDSTNATFGSMLAFTEATLASHHSAPPTPPHTTTATPSTTSKLLSHPVTDDAAADLACRAAVSGCEPAGPERPDLAALPARLARQTRPG